MNIIDVLLMIFLIGVASGIVIWSLIRFHEKNYDHIQVQLILAIQKIDDKIDSTAEFIDIQFKQEKTEAIEVVNFIIDHRFSEIYKRIELTLNPPEPLGEEGEEGMDLEEYLVKMPETIIEAINTNMQELVDQLAPILQNNPLAAMGTDEAITDEDRVKAKTNAANLTINAITEQIPFFDMIANQLDEGWEEKAQANPKAFILMIQNLQQWGAFNFLNALGGGGIQNKQTSQAPGQDKYKPAW